MDINLKKNKIMKTLIQILNEQKSSWIHDIPYEGSLAQVYKNGLA